MIDLSGVKDFNAARFLIYWLVATVIAILVAYNIDPQKKLVWFRPVSYTHLDVYKRQAEGERACQ